MSLAKVYTYSIGAGGSAFMPGGRFFRVIRADADITVEVFDESGSPMGSFDGVRAGLSFGVEPHDIGKGARLTGFGKLKITSATAQTVSVIVSRQPIEYDAVSTTVTVSSGSGITDETPVSVGTSAALLKAAGTGRKGLRFYNAGTADVYLGSSSVTTANGAVKIAPGQTWVEDDAADAAWYGISAVAGQSVRVQVVA